LFSNFFSTSALGPALEIASNSKVIRRIDDALKAIQKRQASTAPIDELERSAINNAVLALESAATAT
jgi:hypothetical protein